MKMPKGPRYQAGLVTGAFLGVALHTTWPGWLSGHPWVWVTFFFIFDLLHYVVTRKRDDHDD